MKNSKIAMVRLLDFRQIMRGVAANDNRAAISLLPHGRRGRFLQRRQGGGVGTRPEQVASC